MGASLAPSSGLVKIWNEHLWMKRLVSEATQLVNGQGRTQSRVLIFGTCYHQLIKVKKHVYDILEKETWSPRIVNETFRRETDRKKSFSSVFMFRIFFALSHPATHTFKESVEFLPIQTIGLLCFLLHPQYHRRFTDIVERKHDFLQSILLRLGYPVCVLKHHCCYTGWKT